MDSVSVLIAVSAVCVVAMTLIAVVATKYNTTIDHLARSADRTAERNDRARDRFCQTLVEKMQVQGNPAAAVQLAQLHANENTRNNDRSFQHDHAVEALDIAAERRRQRQQRRAEENLKAAETLSVQDGM